jgi:hypothetical protein
LRQEIQNHLGGGLAKVAFYMTEDRPIELGRERSLQFGLTLDMLPHLPALLTYFGDVATIDEIRIIEAGQYSPLQAVSRDGNTERDLTGQYTAETYSRLRFTFEDYSGNGCRVPCVAVVGKGFSQEAKYLELTGRSGNLVRVDLNKSPDSDPLGVYPWSSVFFVQGDNAPDLGDAKILGIPDPYSSGRTLKILNDLNGTDRFCRRLDRERYVKLLLDLLTGDSSAVASTLSISEAREVVRALDRIWWAVQRAKPWREYRFGNLAAVREDD